jgi:hypothetical protein
VTHMVIVMSGISPMASAESREFSTSSRIVVYRLLPAYTPPVCECLAVVSLHGARIFDG